MSPDRLSSTFAALADPTRRAILARLAAGEATVNELVAPFALSQPTISKHLRVLEEAELISRRVEGRRHVFTIVPSRMRQAQAWLKRHLDFWEGSFDQLDTLLEDLQQPKKGKRR